MRFNYLAYTVAKHYDAIDLAEVPGKGKQNSNPTIELMHSLTTLRHAYADDTAWCSSFVNHCVLIANYKCNPAAMEKTMKLVGLKDPVIKAFIKEADSVAVEAPEGLKDGPLVLPTWSAWAKSWASWGVSKAKDPRRGDIAVFTRDGGGHVGFFWDYAPTGNIIVLGGNQQNRVCKKTYPKSRLLDIRRAK